MRVGRSADAQRLFAEAKRIFDSVRELWFQPEAVDGISRVLGKQELLLAARRTRSLRKPLSRSQVRRNISIALSHAQYFDAAKLVADSIELPKLRTQSLLNLGVALSNAGNRQAEQIFDEAEQIAGTIKDSQSRARAFGFLAMSLAEAGLFEQAVRVLDESQGSGLLAVLDYCAEAKRSDFLKKYVLRLAYKTHNAIRACGQLVLLYEDQVDAIYVELRKSFDATEPSTV